MLRQKIDYERMFFDGICVYCGMPETCLDHWPPYSKRWLTDLPHWLIPACTECNQLLFNYNQETLIERIAFSKERLRRKHVRLLNRPSWSDTDTEGLAFSMLSAIRRDDYRKRILLDRLAFDYITWTQLGKLDRLLPGGR